MNFDFSLVLVFLTFSSGLIWLLDYLFFARRRQTNAVAKKTLEADSGEVKLPFIVDQAKAFFPIFFIVLILRSFIFEPFRIPSGSMMPTLLIGDFILVNKFDYGLRLPVLNYKIVANKTPQRGDIIVFRYPHKPSIFYIKRVIGLPGDVIDYYDKTVHINGLPITKIENGRYNATGAGMIMDGSELMIEHLDEVTHQILINPHRVAMHHKATVPEGHYFVLGDNRDDSQDSRFWGFVPDENLVGRALMIWMNWDSGIGFSRIGTILNK